MRRLAVADTVPRQPAGARGGAGPQGDLLSAVAADARRVGTTVNLAAFENVLSRTARTMLAGPLADRYLIGQEHERGPGPATLRSGLLSAGYPGVDSLERAAAESMNRMLGAAWTDFRPLSGLHATTCTVALLTNPGDLVLSLAPDDGGHFATRPLLESLGRRSGYLPWDTASGTVDLARTVEMWAAESAAMVFLDHGVPLVPLPVRELRTVMGTDARLVYDASHTLGLIAGGAFQDPLGEGCDIVQGNTHKSFPGAHKGMIAFADAGVGRAFSERLGNSMVSSQSTGATLANYVTTLEMDAHAPAYAAQMQENRAALAQALGEAGFRLHAPAEAPSPSRSHVLVVERHRSRSGYDLAAGLVRSGLVLNARPVDGRVRLRLGVQEVTRRGMLQPDMWRIADLMAEAAWNSGRSAAQDAVAAQVVSLAEEFSQVHFSFDGAEVVS
ncbi:hypothetical protein [Streptomyces sp. NPDC048442]|uniref:hypothetical protein n=1 Tax=Streptomyces sp. NPDC048442 TaxID=3154823 RepID=UPI0034223879